MDVPNLVKMANQIGQFFAAWPDREAARKEVANHLTRFWAPRMRAALLAHVETTAGASGLDPLVTEAVSMLIPCRNAV
jgi:NADH-dependent formate dehydrogenase delta subunit FdsD